ncbi:MAG: FAD-dependent oxidoreductase [Planctomycetota bacterium]|nr:FAD-dependent oxidoreductase [Planctomycetota bacterium]MDG1984840.1 FAD-dependent oxidoreductase [Planctomycetota bacterium]
MKIAILGAGISGMALARFLQQGGVPMGSLHLFEAGPVAGGLCLSKTVDGFTYDVAGGHILFSKDADAMQWMKDEAGGDDAFVERDRHTKIRFEDRWVHYPFENGIGDLPKDANFDCLKGYVEAWHARKMTGSEAPADFKNWIRWRFGDGIADHFMDPYNEKIWKRPLEQITSDWVAGRVPDAPVEDVLRAAVGIRTEGYTHQSIFYYPKTGGFQGITDGLAGTLESQIRLNTPVTSVRRKADGWSVNDEDFDVVVNTIALTYLPEIIEGLPDDVARAMRELEYNGLVTYLVAMDREEHPNLSWIYLPQKKQGPANRVTYMSNYSPGNAPEGKTSFLIEITTPGGQPFPGQELEQEMLQGLEVAGLLKRDEILFTDRSQVNHAYVVFDHEYHHRRALVLDWMEAQGLNPLGRFGRFEYDNSDQCVIKAREKAAAMLPDLLG